MNNAVETSKAYKNIHDIRLYNIYRGVYQLLDFDMHYIYNKIDLKLNTDIDFEG